jgi:thiol-disulfide isomerase/thioredoxin
MNRWLVTTTLFILLAAAATAGAPQERTEAQLLAELKQLAQPPEPKQLRDLDRQEVAELMKARAKSAVKIMAEFEARFPKSPDLPTARSETLSAVGQVDDEDTAAAAAKVAKALLSGAAKGSDHAAQAQLFLHGQAFHKALAGVKLVDDFRAAWAKLADKVRQEAEAYMASYPNYRPGADAVAVLARLAQIAGDDKSEKFFAALIEKHQPGHPLARTAARHKAVGKEFDFPYTPLGSDKTVRLKELRGKVVVIYFWAVWCVPCKAETRLLAELYDKYHKDGLEVVGVSVDEKEELVAKYVKEKKIEWPQWVGEGARKFAADWGVESIPTQFVIDRAGRLQNADAVGSLEELIPTLLREKPR